MLLLFLVDAKDMLYILLGYQVLLHLILHLAIFCVGFFLLRQKLMELLV